MACHDFGGTLVVGNDFLTVDTRYWIVAPIAFRFHDHIPVLNNYYDNDDVDDIDR